MCRKKAKEAHIDTSLIYAYSKAEMYAELEEFISAPNVGRIQEVAERCFSEALYEPAKIMFNSASNFARLATCLTRLGQHQAAVDAARKANATRTWKEVNASCVENSEFRLAQICALHIIVNPDELEELIGSYEKFGHFDEVIAVMEAGLGLERAHMGIFTELGILYSKYKEPKLMEHIKLFWSRLNIRKMLKACEESAQWEEVTFLYLHYDEFDNACLAMIAHPTEAFEHVKFKDTIAKVTNTEIFYKAIDFYLAQQPEKHGLLQFRRIGAMLYKRSKKWAQSIALSKQDKVWDEAISTAAESSDSALAEELLGFFVEQKLNACFAATLFTCYPLLRSDVVLELAWRNGLMDFSMPFMIQTMRELQLKVEMLVEKERKKEEALAEEKKKAEEALASGYSDPTMGGGYADPNGMVVYGQMGGGGGYYGGGY